MKNLVPLALLIGGLGFALFFASVIAGSFFFGDTPTDKDFLWFAIASLVAVIGWRELVAPDGEIA